VRGGMQAGAVLIARQATAGNCRGASPWRHESTMSSSAGWSARETGSSLTSSSPSAWPTLFFFRATIKVDGKSAAQLEFACTLAPT